MTVSKKLVVVRASALVIALAAVGAAALPLAARPTFDPIPYSCPPCLGAVNAYVRVDVAPPGTWSMGTTGGDPDTPDDDRKTMVYGFIPGGYSDVGSSYSTVRIVGPRGSLDAVPTEADTVLQVEAPSGQRVTTVWAWKQPHPTRVTQTLSLATSPFTGREDANFVTYEVRNEDTVETRVGVRALIDVKLGNNDGAPYIVPGVGAVVVEHAFDGAEVPPFWLAFESPTYDPRQLRGVGMLRGEAVTSPDRAVIAYWLALRNKPWEYTIDPTRVITRDSAVALFWDPVPLAPGALRTITTAYGVAGNRGGSVFLASPNARCGETVPVSLFVSNFEAQPLTGGRASLGLPAGLALAPGQAPEQAFASIEPGRTGSVVWQVAVGPSESGDYRVSAEATFDRGKSFTAEQRIDVTCDLQTPTPSAVPPTPSATPPMPTPTATPSLGPEVCDDILTRVPPAAIAQAIAEPGTVGGWGVLCQPNLPPSPWNIQRDRLGLLRPSAPYHPQFNPLVYKCQCP